MHALKLFLKFLIFKNIHNIKNGIKIIMCDFVSKAIEKKNENLIKFFLRLIKLTK